MVNSRTIKRALSLILIFPCMAFADDDDPCRGKEMLLSLINRPSYASSACTVPPKNLLLETGAQYQHIYNNGNQQNYPNAQLRLGLSNRNEFTLSPPIHIQQSIYPFYGDTPVWASFKSRFYYNKDKVLTGEFNISPPSGNFSFGSSHIEATAEVLYLQLLNKKWSYQVQLGFSSFCDSAIDGGRRYQTFNPDLVVNYNVAKKLTAYYECNLQTKVSADDGYGLIHGFGLLYLIRPSLVLDAEYYHRISGAFDVIDFYGLGFSKLFN